MPSRKQVLPEPLGPVATLMPSISSGIGSGRSDPQWTSWTSSIRGIALRPPVPVPVPVVPAIQLRRPAPEVGEALVAGQQGPRLLGGAGLVQGVQQRPGLDPTLAQGQVAGPAQALEHAGKAAVQPRPQQLGQVVGVEPALVRLRLAVARAGLAGQEAQVEPAGGQDGQLGRAQGQHRVVALQRRHGPVQPGQPALGGGRVDQLAAGLAQPAAHLVAGLGLAQLGHVGRGHRPDQQHPAELGGVHQVATSWGSAPVRSITRGGSAAGSPAGARTPVQEMTPTSSRRTTSRRGRGSSSAARLPSPAGPQRDQASTTAAMRAVASAQVPPTTHRARSVSPSPASQVTTSAASSTKSGTTSGDSIGSRVGSGSGTTTGSGRPRCSSSAARASLARAGATAGGTRSRPATSRASAAGSVAATSSRSAATPSSGQGLWTTPRPLAPGRPPSRSEAPGTGGWGWSASTGAAASSSSRAWRRPATPAASSRSAPWPPGRATCLAISPRSARWAAATPAAAVRASSSPRSISRCSSARSRSSTAVAATKGAKVDRSSTPAARARAIAAARTLTARSGAIAGAASTAQTAATRWPSSDRRQAGGRSGWP